MWLLPTRNLFAKSCGLEDVKYFAFFAEPLSALRPFSVCLDAKSAKKPARMNSRLNDSVGQAFRRAQRVLR